MPGTKTKSGGKRTGSGRSSFKPSDEQRELVSQLVAFGMRHADVCRFIKTSHGKPISEPTLRKYFGTELDNGLMLSNVKVAQTLYKKATAGDTASMIFWLKTRADWRDAPQRVELTGNGGGPIQNVNMTAAQFEKIARTIADEV
ncbi:MAG: hypothetical protein LBH31_00535 [Burkholderiaceae bacterium]|jgi:hypothetical protein|nr:hypothetical protein [Burkholderiaceae bacterium]